MDEHKLRFLEEAGAEAALATALSRWAQQSPQPLVLLIDEIDALVGDTLISVLRQLRAGYADRPRAFPQTVVLCGVRDVRDYRIHSSRTQEIITGWLVLFDQRPGQPPLEQRTRAEPAVTPGGRTVAVIRA